MMKKTVKSATVKVSLTTYGKAAYVYQNAAKHAASCEHPTGDFTKNFNGHDQCCMLAKFVLDGKRVCGKHASMILLKAAYEAAFRK